MELKVAQWEYQEQLDECELKNQVQEIVPDLSQLRVLLDTIDETGENIDFHDGNYIALIVHISKSDFDAQPNKMEYAKQKVVEAIGELEILFETEE